MLELEDGSQTQGDSWIQKSSETGDLTHLNNENMDDYEQEHGARSLRRRSRRHSTPTRRSFAEDGEGPSHSLEPPTEYGPPQTTSEPEPHGLPEEVHPEGHQPDEEVGPVIAYPRTSRTS